jgi:two-component system, NarL family, nitrate/nitrite response regulator NarL
VVATSLDQLDRCESGALQRKPARGYCGTVWWLLFSDSCGKNSQCCHYFALLSLKLLAYRSLLGYDVSSSLTVPPSLIRKCTLGAPIPGTISIAKRAMTVDPGHRLENSIRVLVADSSRIYTRLLAEALTRDPILEVIPFETDDPSGLVQVSIDQDIDVLVVSSNLGEQPSLALDFVRQLRVANPKTRAVLLPDSSGDELVVNAFRAGARGIFGRNEPMEFLSKCVRCVYQGQIWASSHDLTVALEALANCPTIRAVDAKGMNLLSERELQVVQCLAEGLSNREIAKRLNLSQHTIKNYLFKIFDKLGVSSRVELLFMSLSHAAAEQAAPPRAIPANGNGDKHPDCESELLKKSAEAGLPAAQLALAQMCLTRRRDPQDLVDAYMWYLIATECAMQARGFITKMLTIEQVEEAKRKAMMWLAKRRQKSPASVPAESRRKHLASGTEYIPVE